jgi:hypothetical protein
MRAPNRSHPREPRHPLHNSLTAENNRGPSNCCKIRQGPPPRMDTWGVVIEIRRSTQRALSIRWATSKQNSEDGQFDSVSSLLPLVRINRTAVIPFGLLTSRLTALTRLHTHGSKIKITMTIDRFEHCSSGSPAASKEGYFTTNMLATPEIPPGYNNKRRKRSTAKRTPAEQTADIISPLRLSIQNQTEHAPQAKNRGLILLFTCWCARCWGHGLRVVDQSLVLGNAVRGGGNNAVLLLHVVGRSPGKVVTADLSICVSEGFLMRGGKGIHTST